MANKRKSDKKRRKVTETEGRDEYGIARRIGSALTLLLVSVVTVVLGFIIGRYLILDVFNSSLGVDLAAQTASTNSGSTKTNSTGEANLSGAAGQTSNVASAPTPTLPASSTAANSRSSGSASTSQPSETVASSSPVAATKAEPPAPKTQVQSQSSNSGSAALPGQSPTLAPAQSNPTANVLYRVQVSGSSERAPAEKLLESLKAAFPDAFITLYEGEFRVQVGAFSTLDGAQDVTNRLRSLGHQDVHLITVSR